LILNLHFLLCAYLFYAIHIRMLTGEKNWFNRILSFDSTCSNTFDDPALPGDEDNDQGDDR